MAFQVINAGSINNDTAATTRAGSSTTVTTVNPALTSKRENIIPFQNGTIGAVDDIQRVLDINGNKINKQQNAFAPTINIEPIQNIKTTEDANVYRLLDNRFYDGYVEDFTRRPFTPTTDTYNIVSIGTDAALSSITSYYLVGGKINTGN